VHDWRVKQLKRLGIPGHLAEGAAVSHVDWHEIARLVQCGCPRCLPSASSADAVVTELGAGRAAAPAGTVTAVRPSRSARYRGCTCRASGRTQMAASRDGRGLLKHDRGGHGPGPPAP
jgi:hypothetical protein